jgi:predicted enzyme involved in methoxymalonyl-ACP biosynthesis
MAVPHLDREHLDRIREAEDGRALFALLEGMDAMGLAGREAEIVARALKRTAGDRERFRVALLGNHTLDPLASRLAVHAAIAGIEVATWVAPYGQYMQAVLQQDGALSAARPRLVFLSLLMRELAPVVHGDFASLDAAGRAAERDRILSHLDDWVGAALSATDALLLIGNFPRPVWNALGTADSREPLGESEFYLSLNLELVRRYRDEPRVAIVDVERLLLAHGFEHAMSERLYHIAKLAWSDSFQARVADELTRWIVAARGTARKCVVVDLDNTLWGGITGEDGPAALQIGNGTPAGEAHAAFQRAGDLQQEQSGGRR